MGGSSPTFGPGKGVSVEKPSGDVSSLSLVMPEKGDLKVCKDYKVFPCGVCFSQHRLLTLDIHIKRRPRMTEMAVKHRIWWKDLYGEAIEAFRVRVIEGVTTEVEGRIIVDTKHMWNSLEYAKHMWNSLAGTLIMHIGHKESWWLSDEKRRSIKKKKREKTVDISKGKVYKDLYKRLDSKKGENDICMICKARERMKMDFGSLRFIKDEDGISIINEDVIRSALFNGQRRARTEEVESIRANP
ncbi:hypothetical protein Tco_0385709 [Tanacetum coccineum]